MAMASGRLRTPGKRVHSEPTRRPIVRSGALELAGAKRSIRGSLLRSTVQWTGAWPSLLLAGGKRAPFSRRPSLTPESTTPPTQQVAYPEQGGFLGGIAPGFRAQSPGSRTHCWPVARPRPLLRLLLKEEKKAFRKFKHERRRALLRTRTPCLALMTSCFASTTSCFASFVDVLCFVRRRTSCFSLVIWLVCFAMRDVVLCSVTRSTQRRMK